MHVQLPAEQRAPVFKCSLCATRERHGLDHAMTGIAVIQHGFELEDVRPRMGVGNGPRVVVGIRDCIEREFGPGST
jgi:hypothetical protein